jgi:hypothetical protein
VEFASGGLNPVVARQEERKVLAEIRVKRRAKCQWRRRCRQGRVEVIHVEEVSVATRWVARPHAVVAGNVAAERRMKGSGHGFGSRCYGGLAMVLHGQGVEVVAWDVAGTWAGGRRSFGGVWQWAGCMGR